MEDRLETPGKATIEEAVAQVGATIARNQTRLSSRTLMPPLVQRNVPSQGWDIEIQAEKEDET
jgi:hypothetical protein